MSDNIKSMLGEENVPDEGYDVKISYHHRNPIEERREEMRPGEFGSALGETAAISQALNEEPHYTLLFDTDEGYVAGIHHVPEESGIKGFKVDSEDLQNLKEVALEDTEDQFGSGNAGEWWGLMTLSNEDKNGETSSVVYQDGVPEAVDNWFYDSIDHLTVDDYDPKIMRDRPEGL